MMEFSSSPLTSHSPQGECGLKYIGQLHGLLVAEVTPRKGSVD